MLLAISRPRVLGDGNEGMDLYGSPWSQDTILKALPTILANNDWLVKGLEFGV